MANALYKPSIIAGIVRLLPGGDIVVIHGARQVGKTSVLMFLREALHFEGEQAWLGRGAKGGKVRAVFLGKAAGRHSWSPALLKLKNP